MTTRPAGTVNIVNAAVGVCFIVLGVLLLLERNDMLAMEQIVKLWPVALIVLGAAAVWQASRSGDAMPRSGSGAGWLLWLVVIGAVASYTYDRRADQSATGGDVNAFAVMGSDRPTIEGVFRRGRITAVMGGVDMNMRNATLAPGETAVLDVFAMWGGANIRMPETWDVSIEATTVAGGINDQRRGGDADAPPAVEPPAGADQAAAPDAAASAAPALAPPRLIITGTVVMGGVNLRR